jgi:MFS family permease
MPENLTPETGVALPGAVQQRNLLLFAGCIAMQYLAAPVIYVGMAHAALLDRMGASKMLANTPEVLYLLLTPTPVLLAVVFPAANQLKRLLAASYLLTAAGMALVLAVITLSLPAWVVQGAVLLQAVITGVAMPLAITLVWEAMGRGVDRALRGRALSLAYGCGPFFAFVGAQGSQLLLTGETWFLKLPGALPFPFNFALVFGAAIPAMLLAAFLAAQMVVPLPAAAEPPQGLFTGLADFASSRLLRTAAIVTVLLYVGNTIPANMTLHTRAALQADPSDYVMHQQTLRFVAKGVAGLLLGWMLARTSPRAGMLATGCVFMLAPLWAGLAEGRLYLLAFAIYGGGELVGVYAPNYILEASRPSDLRRNMAISNLLMAPAAPAGLLFGRMADLLQQPGRPEVGLRASFALCAAIMAVGLLLAVWKLPPHPRAAQAT